MWFDIGLMGWSTFPAPDADASPCACSWHGSHSAFLGTPQWRNRVDGIPRVSGRVRCGEVPVGRVVGVSIYHGVLGQSTTCLW